MRWSRITEPDRLFDGYRIDGAEVTDNGGGYGPARGSGRWAVIVRGRWLANVDTLREAKARAEMELQD